MIPSVLEIEEGGHPEHRLLFPVNALIQDENCRDESPAPRSDEDPRIKLRSAVLTRRVYV